MNLKPTYKKASFYCRLPLIWASWRIRSLIGPYIRRKATQKFILPNSQTAVRWQCLPQLMNHPYGIPFLMTTGPRWNTHAVIATISGLKIKKVLEIQAQVADRSTQSWTVVVYNDLAQTIAYRGSSQRNGESWEKLELSPGTYSLALRYYEPTAQALLPKIKVDGAVVTDNQDCSKEFDVYQRYLGKIKQRKSLFFTLMHYYVYALLKWPSLASEQRIRQEYLPVGNPETHFRYGAIDKGKHLHVDCSEQLLEKALVYLTILNQSSFPQMWTRITTTDYQSPPVPMSGTWLMRIVKINEDDIAEDFAQLSVILE